MPKGKTFLQEHQRKLLFLLEEFDRVCRQLRIPYVLFAGTLLGAVRHQDFIPWDDDLDVMMLREDYDRFLREAGTVLDQERFFLQKEFSEHWPMFFSKLRLNGTACLEKYHPRDSRSHQGIYMDIFPCDCAAKTAPGRRIQFFASKVVIAKALDRRGYDTASIAKKLFMTGCRFLPGNVFLKITKRGMPDSELVHSFLGAASSFEKNVYSREWFTRRTQVLFHGRSYPAPEQFHQVLTTLYGDYMRIPPPEERETKKHAILVDTERSYEAYLHYRDNMTFDVYTRSIR